METNVVDLWLHPQVLLSVKVQITGTRTWLADEIARSGLHHALSTMHYVYMSIDADYCKLQQNQC